jgi:hypothetical protein
MEKKYAVITFSKAHFLITEEEHERLKHKRLGEFFEDNDHNKIRTNDIAEILTMPKYYEQFPEKRAPIIPPAIQFPGVGMKTMITNEKRISALEAMKQLVTYVLHVAVATAVMTAALGLPKILNAWSGMLRLKRRAARRAARRGQPVEARVTMPRGGANKALVWMATQLAKQNPSPLPPQTKSAFGEGASNDIHLNF